MRDHGDVGRTRRQDRRRFVTGIGVALLPAVVLLVVIGLGPQGPEGRFRGALAGLVVVTAIGAFGTGAGHVQALRLAMGRVAWTAVVTGLAYGVRGMLTGSGGGGLDVGVLCLGSGAAACGLSALGRAMRTPALAAGAVAACVLWTAMAGLFWADPVAEQLERTRRRSFRQAVLHLDPSLAMAYGAAGYDRLRSEGIYFDVPLASSFYERPQSGTTGLTWLLAGLVAWSAALPFAMRREPRDDAADGAGATPGRRRSMSA